MQKFDMYKETGNLYLNLSYIRHWLNCIFTSQEFQYNCAYPQDVLAQLVFGQKESKEADNKIGEPQYYFKHLKDIKKVETMSKGYPIQFRLSTEPRDSSHNEKALKLVKTFIPNFKMPTNWKVENNSEGIRSVVPIFQPISNSITLKTLTTTKPSYTPDTKADDADRLYLPTIEDEDKYHFIDHVTVELEVKECKTNLSSGYVSAGSGSFDGLRADLIFTVDVIFKVRFPEEYALWSTYSKSMKDFVPTQFLNIVNQNSAYNFVDGANPPTQRIKSLSSIKEDNENKIRSGDRTLKPRVNEDSFIMLRNGLILWLPNTDNVKQYEELERSRFDPKTGLAKSTKDMGMSNKPLYLDWLKNMFVYINDAGNLDYVSLLGGIPLAPQTIARLLATPVASWEGEDFFSTLAKHFKQDISVTVHGKTHYISLRDVVKFLPPGLTWGQLGYNPNARAQLLLTDKPSNNNNQVALPDNTIKDKKNEDLMLPFPEEYEEYRNLIDSLQPIFAKAVQEFTQINCSLQVKMRMLRLCLTLVTKYAPYQKQFNDSYETNKRINSYRLVGRPQNTQIANMPGLKNLMPHQARDQAELSLSPDNVMLDVQAGGGKSSIMAGYFMNLIKDKKVKRPLLFMPDKLIKSFIDDINTFSQGKINVFPMNMRVMDRLSNSMGFEVKKIRQMIMSMPPNTIFVAGYNFVKSKRGLDGMSHEDFLYCTKKIAVFPNAEFLIECDFDLVANDESHKLKNLDSQVNQAVSLVIAQANKKILASGTLISNTASDYVGQMAMFEPTVFGSKDQFNENYGASVENGKILAMAAGAERKIQEAMLPYTKKITNKRREWAPFLPGLIESTHPVRMDSVQQEFYDDLMNNAYNEMMGNPKYRKLLTSAREEDAEKIEAAMKRYFAKVEIFLNAPESNEAFVKLHGEDSEEVISPKVNKINEILDAHFKGGIVDEHTIKPSDGKVIIFGYNRSVSPHILKHMKYQNLTTHVTASDEDSFVKWQNDPKSIILLADEGSIKEGYNCQMATRLIRVQTLWNPGDQEQALMRMMRPDPLDKYGRDKVDYHWIFCEYSIEVPKMARMFSKIISKARNDEYGQPGWSNVEKQLEELPLIKMSLDLLKQFKVDSDLDEYWNSYKLYREWEYKQFHEVMDMYKNEYKYKYGKTPTRQELMQFVMVPVEHTEIENSKKAYVPFVEGMTIPNDVYGLGLKPITLMEPKPQENEEEDNDEEDDEEEAVKVQAGDAVFTEFGPGEVIKAKDKSVEVKIHGIGEVKLPKSVVFVAHDFGQAKSPKQDKLEKLHVLNKDTSLTITPGKHFTIKDVKVPDSPITKKILPKPESTKVEEEEDNNTGLELKRSEDKNFDIIPAAINNQIALFTKANKDIDHAIGNGWKKTDPFIYTMVKNKNGFDNLIEALKKKKLEIGAVYMNPLNTVRNRMVGSGGRFMQNTPLKLNDINNFFRVNSRPTKGNMIRPYPIVWDNKLHVCINARTHSKLLGKIRGSIATGVTPWKLNGAMAIKFFPNKNMAMEALKKINKRVEITNMDQAIRELKGLTIHGEPTKKKKK